jgi:molybdate transport system substrate-binding protein
MDLRRRCLSLFAGTLAFAFYTANSSAAEFKVVVRPELVPMLIELTPKIENLTETRLVIDAASGAFSRRFSEPFDVAIIDGPMATALAKQGKVAPGLQPCIGWTGLGLAVRAGAAKPDLATEDGLRRALLSAHAIAFSGDQETGAQFRRVLARLDVADQIAARLVDTGNRPPLEALTDGRVDVAIALQSEIVTTAGVEAADTWPIDLQFWTPVFAVIGSEAAMPDTARPVVTFLTSFDAAKAIHAIGLETFITE